jgi:hypothetical protein
MLWPFWGPGARLACEADGEQIVMKAGLHPRVDCSRPEPKEFSAWVESLISLM